MQRGGERGGDHNAFVDITYPVVQTPRVNLPGIHRKASHRATGGGEFYQFTDLWRSDGVEYTDDGVAVKLTGRTGG